MTTAGLHRHLLVIPAIVVALIGTDPVAAKTVYVSPSGNDANDGSSWATAKLTVQAGLDAAESDDQVWVAAGTYIANLFVRTGIGLYGGFAGSETDLAQRDWKANPTILDGNQTGSVVRVLIGDTDTARIDGFTIGNGKAELGGGIYCSGSYSLTICNNTITRNSAGGGGGVCCSWLSSPIISNNTITGNSASSRGGGIYCESDSLPEISSNTITGNSGSGIDCASYSYPAIVNNIVAFNSSGVCNTDGTPTLWNNCVYNPTGANYTGVSAGPGDISADPQLLAPGYGDLHLRAGSPCIDAGLDSAVQAGELDMDGEPRIQGAHVDIGADEFNGSEPLFTPKVIRVSPSGDDANDGSSWALAKLTVQAGIDAVANAGGGDVWVAAGTYSQRITLKPWAYVYGGFEGTETHREQRNWARNVTILDGGAIGSVVTASASGYHVSAVDGFTIRNGKADEGGGVYCDSSSPAISNSTITGNSGGGICYRSGSPAIAGNTITGNTGNGIDCYSSSLPTTISNNTIAGNSGSGIYCDDHAWPAISNNTITGNSDSGIYCYDAGPAISNNTIKGNRASYGGGIHCEYYSSPAIANNTITGNSAGSYGGGICCERYSSPAIANNTITGNSASLYGATSYGGGIYCTSSSPTIINNTITGNSAATYGGGICCDSSSPGILNNIVAFNSSGLYNTGGTPTLRNNCVCNPAGANYTGVSAGAGDISADPQLLAPGYGDIHLRAGSPCIDAGLDSAVQVGTLDADGEPRTQRAHVDIGADEFNGTEPLFMLRAIRVSPSGDDANDGSSWALAKLTVQAGIDAVANAGGGDVWVAAGMYGQRITLKTWVHVYGGFSGTETHRGQRSWARNVTILDGGAGGSVVTALTCGYGVSAIDGFTIRNGKANEGGGIFCAYGSSPVISNNTIQGNSARYGGGIDCYHASPAISNNTITGNSASSFGGGIYCERYSSPAISSNTITGNSAGSNGGGIGCSPSSFPTIINTIIAYNSSGLGADDSVTSRLRHNCVYGNVAYDYSAATDPTGSNGNISVDPGFVRSPSPGADGKWATADDDPGDLQLKAGSPCIDAGVNSALPAELADLGGHTRRIDDPATEDCRWAAGTCGTAPIVDIGAYEFIPMIPGDFDHDGDVDIDDLNTVLACISGSAIPYSGDCAKADFDSDGDVDQSDFGVIQRCCSGTGEPADPNCAN